MSNIILSVATNLLSAYTAIASMGAQLLSGLSRNIQNLSTAIQMIPPSNDKKIIERTVSGTYNNSNISAVGSYAFCNCSNLRVVALPYRSSVPSLGNSAFYRCDSLIYSGAIYVPSSLGSAFVQASDWSSISGRILPVL